MTTRAERREALRVRREIERTASQVSATYRGPALRRNEQTALQDAIWQGEMRLRDGSDSNGNKLSAGQRAAIERAVEQARAELAELEAAE